MYATEINEKPIFVGRNKKMRQLKGILENSIVERQ